MCNDQLCAAYGCANTLCRYPGEYSTFLVRWQTHRQRFCVPRFDVLHDLHGRLGPRQRALTCSKSSIAFKPMSATLECSQLGHEVTGHNCIRCQGASNVITKPVSGSNLCVVLPPAARIGRQGTFNTLLKRQRACTESSSSLQSNTSILTSSLQMRTPRSTLLLSAAN